MKETRDAAHEMNPSRKPNPQKVSCRGAQRSRGELLEMKMWQGGSEAESTRTQKGAIKSGFNNSEFQQSRAAEFFMLDWYLGITIRNSKAKIKSSRDSLRLKFNARKKRPGGGSEAGAREMETEMNAEAISNNIFSVHHVERPVFVLRRAEKASETEQLKIHQKHLIYYSNKTLFPL